MSRAPLTTLLQHLLENLTTAGAFRPRFPAMKLSRLLALVLPAFALTAFSQEPPVTPASPTPPKVITKEHTVFVPFEKLEEVFADEIMTRDVKTIQIDTPVSDAVRFLEEAHLIRVPVMKGDKLVGILARRDILFGYIKATAEYWP